MYPPQAFLLALARIAAIIGMAVVFGRNRLPVRVRVALAFGVTLAIAPVLPATWFTAAASITDPLELVLAMLNQVLLGAAVSLACDVVLAVCHFAGFLIGFGSSLSMAQVVDPASGVSVDIISGALQLACLLTLILCNVHLALLKLIHETFFTIGPVSSQWLSNKTPADFARMTGQIFELGLKLAAPAVAIALVLDMSMGLVARMAPDFDILFLSLPIRLSLGLVAFGFVLRCGEPFFRKLGDLLLGQCKWMLAT